MPENRPSRRRTLKQWARKRFPTGFLLPLGYLLGLLALIAAVPCGSASAQPLLRETLRHGRQVRIVVTRADGELRVRAGPARGLLPLAEAEQAEVELVELGTHTAVAVVRARQGSRGAAALIAWRRAERPKWLWSGHTDLRGDPGERIAWRVEVEDRTGDGKPDVVVGAIKERSNICGSPESLLYPRAVDAGSLRLRPVLLDRFAGQGAPAASLSARAEGPGVETPPLVRGLTFTAASSALGADGPAMLTPPAVLTDGDAASSWVEGRGGRGEFVTGRWSARDWPIRALAITFARSHAEGAGRFTHPKRLWLVGDGGQRLRVDVTDDPAQHPGERFWIVPDEPLDWRCLSIVLDETFEDDLSRHTSIAEVEAYTELDFGGGVQRLVDKLARGQPSAAELLERIGAPAVEPLRAQWKRLSVRGRLRALRVFRHVATHDGGSEQAIAALAVAARDPTEQVREVALAALADAEAADALGDLLQGETADAAARLLSRVAPVEAVDKLVRAMRQDPTGGRRALRAALREALQRGADPALEAAERAASDVEQPATIGAIAMAAARVQPAFAERLLGRVMTQASDFATRWRITQAAREMPAAPRIDGWLQQVAAEDERWMLRDAALEALHQHEAPGASAAARQRLQDGYPRVRATAVRVLHERQADEALFAERLREDRWPMVREAALDALGDARGFRELLHRAVRDRSKRVRAAAIRALTKRRDRGAWPLIEARLRSDNEWPVVSRAAIEYARTLCVSQSKGALRQVLDRGLAPNPWDPDIALAAAAVRALAALGGDEAEAALRAASVPAVPASIRLSAEKALKDPQRCTP